MKEVILAKSAGFCFGVQRAMDTVYAEADKKNVYTYGPIIHNTEVVNELESKGVKAVNDISEIPEPEKSTVIIRSHGVSKAVYESIKNSGAKIVDATCPFVLKIHKIVKDASAEGDQIVIIGNEKHPEVEGIMGWSETPVHVVDTVEKAEKLKLDKSKNVRVVSQTTFNYKKFQDLVEIISEKGYDISVLDTICNATEERQTEARAIARKVDAMFVVGGRHSSNTQKLYEICKEECKNTYFIETLVDLESKPFQSFGRVGITAGASTPNKIIEEVQKMSEMSFEQMLDESFKTIRNGEVVEGTVIDVKDDQIILNIGYKADGILTKNEYSNDSSIDLHTVAQPGDKMEVKVLKVNDGEGQVLLTYKRLAAEKGNKRLEEAFENHEVLKAKVTQVLNGGLSVVVEETRVFIPASLVSDVYEKDLSKYADQEIEFVITEFNPRRRRIIGDRKQLIVAEKKREEILILLQALNQCIVNVIKIRKFKIFDGIIPCAGFQLVGLQQNIPNLQHRFDRHIVIVGFSCATVDLRNNLGKPFFFCFGQAKTLSGRQLYHRLCDKVWSSMFLRLFLNEIGSLDFTVQIISAARMLDIDVSQQISDEVIFLMQVGILETGHL